MNLHDSVLKPFKNIPFLMELVWVYDKSEAADRWKYQVFFFPEKKKPQAQ